MKFNNILILCIILANYSTVFGFSGRVVSILDGDTIEVYKQGDNFKTTVDLYGIDCPEKQQYFGKSAKLQTANLTGGKTIWVDAIKEYRSGRISGLVWVDNKNVNTILVAKGWAWVIPDDCEISLCDEWQELQNIARKNRIGLWTAIQPIAPWEWREKGKKEFFYYAPDGKTPVWKVSP